MTVGLKDRERRNAPLDCECDGNYRCEQNPSRATITRKNRAAIHQKGRGRQHQKQHKRLVSRNPDRHGPGDSAREPPRARHIGGLQNLRTPLCANGDRHQQDQQRLMIRPAKLRAVNEDGTDRIQNQHYPAIPKFHSPRPPPKKPASNQREQWRNKRARQIECMCRERI